MYLNIKDDYYGIMVTFNDEPISNISVKQFVFAGHELIGLLGQSWQRIYELVLEKINFKPGLGFPIKAYTPDTWLDMAQLLEQGKHHADTTPKLSMDVGGRKIVSYIPSDKYCYDRGNLPRYEVIDTPGCYIVRAGTPHETDIVMDVDQLGDNPLLNEKKKDRLSYIDFYKALRAHYGPTMNSSVIANECRLLLSGHRLNLKHAPILPVMLATMFCAEVSRNRVCLITGIMLFDLIQAKIVAPSEGQKKSSYCFENTLWHPSLYDCTSSERSENKSKVELGKLGGFHPMAHIGSWSDEFREHGAYQNYNPLSLSHQKSLVILIDWLKHIHSDGMTITKLSKSEYENAVQLDHDTTTVYQTQYPRFQLNSLIIVNFLYPLILKRMSNFDFMLTASSCENRSDNEFSDLLRPPYQPLHPNKSNRQIHSGLIKNNMFNTDAQRKTSYRLACTSLTRGDYQREIGTILLGSNHR